jgi:hypothetical protein
MSSGKSENNVREFGNGTYFRSGIRENRKNRSGIRESTPPGGPLQWFLISKILDFYPNHTVHPPKEITNVAYLGSTNFCLG